LKRIFILTILVISLSLDCVLAASIAGRVLSQMDKRSLDAALVILVSPNTNAIIRTAVSDTNGYFRIDDIVPGIYNLEVARDGYYKNALFDLHLESDRKYEIMVRLLKQEKGAPGEYCFMLGSIEVYPQMRNLIPDNPVTTYTISSGEIEHMQATSLGDVLFLVPGIERTNNPGLGEPSYVGIRTNTVDDIFGQLGAFGSTVIIDGGEVTTDANANRYTAETGRSGIDLRTVPADNIRSVEVIAGIPSVEYGNFTNGIIKVNLKHGDLVPKLKVKMNPDTRSASFSNGHRIGQGVLDYFLDYAYCERNPRKTEDEYQRLYLTGAYVIESKDRKRAAKIRSTFTKYFDDEQPTDILRMQYRDHGYKTSLLLDLSLSPASDVIYKGFFSVDLNRKNFYRERWVSEQIVKPDSIYPGFIGKMKEIGVEWAIESKLSRKKIITTGRTKSELLTGLEWQLQMNRGEGLIIDEEWPFFGFQSPWRSYSFALLPELQQWSVFIEDNVTGKLLKRKCQLILGLRYDAFNPTGISFKEWANRRSLITTRHGDFLSPRINLHYFLNDNVRLRFGAGQSVKSISLGYIYIPPAYRRIAGDSCEVQPQDNPDLQAYPMTKYEVALDWKLMQIFGFSLTGYLMKARDMPTNINYPWGYEINPDTLTSNTYVICDNMGWVKTSGIELVMNTKRLPNFQYKLSVNYRFDEHGNQGLLYDGLPRDWEEIWYPYSSLWSERIIIDHQLNYISARLGVWWTLEAQHIPLDHRRTVFHSNSTIKNVDGQDYRFYQGMVYWYETELYDMGGRWLANFRVTKALSQTAEISIYINNVLDDRAAWKDFTNSYHELNPRIFYGLEFSARW
jgi:outer membrane receptor protein involved in Fe transport